MFINCAYTKVVHLRKIAAENFSNAEKKSDNRNMIS